MRQFSRRDFAMFVKQEVAELAPHLIVSGVFLLFAFLVPGGIYEVLPVVGALLGLVLMVEAWEWFHYGPQKEESILQIKLGSKVRDVITGYTGIATGRVEYITGCDQLLVSPPVKDGGEFVESKWLDKQRLVAVAEPDERLMAELKGTQFAGGGVQILEGGAAPPVR